VKGVFPIIKNKKKKKATTFPPKKLENLLFNVLSAKHTLFLSSFCVGIITPLHILFSLIVL